MSVVPYVCQLPLVCLCCCSDPLSILPFSCPLIVQDTASKVADKAAEAATAAKETGSQLAGQAQETASRAAQATKDTASQAYSAAADTAARTQQAAQVRLQWQPCIGSMHV
jgi:hypothetical protein